MAFTLHDVSYQDEQGRTCRVPCLSREEARRVADGLFDRFTGVRIEEYSSDRFRTDREAEGVPAGPAGVDEYRPG